MLLYYIILYYILYYVNQTLQYKHYILFLHNRKYFLKIESPGSKFMIKYRKQSSVKNKSFPTLQYTYILLYLYVFSL